MPDAHFTLVFRGDIRQQAGNPFHTDTPFGRPETVARGDVTAERDALEEERDQLAQALTAARADAEAARGRALEEAARIATRAGEEMTERGPWDEGMRDMAVRISVILQARAAHARRAGSSP